METYKEMEEAVEALAAEADGQTPTWAGWGVEMCHEPDAVRAVAHAMAKHAIQHRTGKHLGVIMRTAVALAEMAYVLDGTGDDNG